MGVYIRQTSYHLTLRHLRLVAAILAEGNLLRAATVLVAANAANPDGSPGEIGVRIKDNVVTLEAGARSLTGFGRDLSRVGGNVPEFDAFVSTAETSPPDQVLAALAAMVQAEVGAVMFSCSTFDLTASQSRRVCINMTDVYPVSGLKLIVPNAPTGQVLGNRTTFVANMLAKIKTVVPDHALTRCRLRPAKVDGQPESPCASAGDNDSARPPTLPGPGPDGWVWPCPAYEKSGHAVSAPSSRGPARVRRGEKTLQTSRIVVHP